MEETNDKKYCVYMHISPSDKKYIGITSMFPPENRWKNGRGYKHNEYFIRAINKYGWENFQHIIIADNLTEDEAMKMESSLILEYKTMDLNYGYNLTSGGEIGKNYSAEIKDKMSKNHADVSGENNPNYGVKVSQETRNKISQALIGKMSGDRHPLYGKGHTEETKRKISQKAKERMSVPENVPFYGRKHTEESKQKMREHHIDVSGDKNPNYGKGRKVVQLTIDDDYIAQYNTASEASRIIGVCLQNIISCCRKMRCKSAGGFKWMYKEDYDKLTQQNDLTEEEDEI